MSIRTVCWGHEALPGNNLTGTSLAHEGTRHLSLQSAHTHTQNSGAPIWKFPKITGPQYRPQYTIVLIMGTPKKVPLILGNPHIPTDLSGSSGLGAREFPDIFWAPGSLGGNSPQPLDVPCFAA